MTFDVHDDAGTWRPRTEQETTGGNRFIAPGSATNGEFGLFDGVLAPGQGAVPHYHQGFSESFYLLSGELRIRVGERHGILREGDFLYVPPRGVHVFRNDGADDARLLMLFVPGAPREAYFREMAAAFADGATPTPDDLDAIAARHDQVNLRDPRWALPTGDAGE